MKSGIRTTEFWATIIASIIIAGASELGLSLDAAETTGTSSNDCYLLFRQNCEQKQEAIAATAFDTLTTGPLVHDQGAFLLEIYPKNN